MIVVPAASPRPSLSYRKSPAGESFGIEARHELPGVGEHLRDHINARIQYHMARPNCLITADAGLWPVAKALRYAVTRRFVSLPSAPMLAFLKTRAELETPDVQMHIMPMPSKIRKNASCTISGDDHRGLPIAPGKLGIDPHQSANPTDQPAIRFKFCPTQSTVTSYRGFRQRADGHAGDAKRGTEFSPGAEIETDDQILDYIRGNSETAYHPVGTCRMGQGPGAVVDGLRVHGLHGLRVADASIMPTMVSGNTNAACIMIGEKCADLLKEDHAAANPRRRAPRSER